MSPRPTGGYPEEVPPRRSRARPIPALPVLLAAVFLAAGPSAAADRASEAEETSREALKNYIEGRQDAAASGYEYLSTLGSLDPGPSANLALMLRDSGRPADASAHWLKATMLAPQDPFLWCQRGWSYLTLGRFREARDAFREAVKFSTSSFFAGEAQLGLGLGEAFDGNVKPAAAALQETVARSPYLQPAAGAELGRLWVDARRLPESIPFFMLSLGQDDKQPDVIRELGAVYEKTGQGRAAWQAYKLVLDMDPADEETAGRKTRLERYIEGRPSDSLPVLRLARPMNREVDPAEAARDAESPALRVAMFTGPDGMPRHLTRFYVMGSTTTGLFDLRLGDTMAAATAFTQWEVSYRPDTRVIEIRDPVGRIVYVTKQPFRLEPVSQGHTVLIKSPEVTDLRGMDIGDRELRGKVEVIPTPFGFHIVNEASLEEYLFSVVGSHLPPGAPSDAYKTLAVLLRTKLGALLRKEPGNPERTHTCDSEKCIPYHGLSRERLVGTRAVRATRHVTMALPDGSEPEFHPSCGWATGAGIQDRPVPSLAFRSPLDLERLVHGYPDRSEYSEASALVPTAWTRWLRVFDVKDLRRRMDRIKPVGPIEHVRAVARDASGRVLELEVRGARGTARLSGGWIEEWLSPHSLRSTLFTLQPLYEGRTLRRLLVWGAGTGHGRGLCVAGAMGQANLGRGFDEILAFYFPGVRLGGVAPRSRAGERPPVRTSTRGRTPAPAPADHRPPRKRRRQP